MKKYYGKKVSQIDIDQRETLCFPVIFLHIFPIISRENEKALQNGNKTNFEGKCRKIHKLLSLKDMCFVFPGKNCVVAER